MTSPNTAGPGAAARAMILPLALAQFIASYAATNMNVAISAIAKDLDTNVGGVQTAITLFTLTMAALMIPGSKLTDIWGRKRCFIIGLIIYGAGGLLAALSFGLGALIVGYSLGEGVGSALMIPPIYILVTVAFPDIKSRARYFGVIRGAADRRPGDQRDQLAGIIRPAGPRGGLDHPPLPEDQRPGPDRAEATVRPDGGHPVGGRAVLRCARAASGQDLRIPGVASGLQDRQHGGDPEGLDFAGVDLRGHRRPVPAVVLPACAVRGAQGTGGTAAAAAVPQQG